VNELPHVRTFLVIPIVSLCAIFGPAS